MKAPGHAPDSPSRAGERSGDDLVEALMRSLVGQCIDIEKLAWFEQSLIEMMVADDRDRDRVTQLVQDQIDQTWQGLMFEFEHIRDAECPDCARERLDPQTWRAERDDAA